MWKQLSMCFISSLLIYTAIIHFSGTTTKLTMNGVYKMRDVKDYIKTHDSKKILNANIIYAPVVEQVRYIIPKSRLYLVASYINAFFASIAICAWLIIVKAVGIDKWGIILLLLYQGLKGLFFWLAVSCEDIMPAFACWLLSFALLLHWNKNKEVWLWIAANILLHISWLFHWTFLFAAVPAVVFSGGMLIYNYPKRNNLIIISSLLFIGIVSVVTFFTDRSVFTLLFPGKGLDTLWVGWDAEKIFIALYYSFANLLFGRVQHPEVSSLPEVILSIFFTLFLSWAVFISWKYFRKYDVTQTQKTLLIFGVVSFLIGQVVNVYEQGDDPQFLIQPMFSASIFLCLAYLSRGHLKIWRRGVIALLLLLLISNSTSLLFNWQLDRKGMNHLVATEKEFGPCSNWLYLCAREDILSPWMVYQYGYDSIQILSLPLYQTNVLKMNPPQYFEYIKLIIDSSEKTGKKIVTNSMLKKDQISIGQIYNGYDLSEQQRYLQQQLLNSYKESAQICADETDCYQLLIAK